MINELKVKYVKHNIIIITLIYFIIIIIENTKINTPSKFQLIKKVLYFSYFYKLNNYWYNK